MLKTECVRTGPTMDAWMPQVQYPKLQTLVEALKMFAFMEKRSIQDKMRELSKCLNMTKVHQ